MPRLGRYPREVNSYIHIERVCVLPYTFMTAGMWLSQKPETPPTGKRMDNGGRESSGTLFSRGTERSPNTRHTCDGPQDCKAKWKALCTKCPILGDYLYGKVHSMKIHREKKEPIIGCQDMGDGKMRKWREGWLKSVADEVNATELCPLKSLILPWLV